MTADLLAQLEAGSLRAAAPDPAAPTGWRTDASVMERIIALFADRRDRSYDGEDAFRFSDRVAVPPRTASLEGRRVVPGGTTLRAGSHLGEGVVVMPPSYVNVGAWIGAGTMVDSHVLVGSCAQIGERVHLSAGVTIGGVLEPPGARPVIVEDDAFVGAGSGVLEGVLVGRRAVIGAGVILTATTRLYDLTSERLVVGTRDDPLAVPAGAVVVAGTRALEGGFAEQHGLGVAVALIVKWRDEGTDARTALEPTLR